MGLSWRQFWLMVHLGVGVVLIHAFAGGVASLIRPRQTRRGEWARRATTLAMAGVAWLTVLTGTFLAYPWYRAKPAEGASTVSYPKEDLISSPDFSAWHTFGMEWKEHVGWLAPFLATSVAVVILRHAKLFHADWRLRRTTIALFLVTFAIAVVAASLGAAINNVAPNQFLRI